MWSTKSREYRTSGCRNSCLFSAAEGRPYLGREALKALNPVLMVLTEQEKKVSIDSCRLDEGVNLCNYCVRAPEYDGAFRQVVVVNLFWWENGLVRPRDYGVKTETPEELTEAQQIGLHVFTRLGIAIGYVSCRAGTDIVDAWFPSGGTSRVPIDPDDVREVAF